MSNKNSVRVAVIGAGCSGIAAIKNLLQEGITEVVCFEQNSRIGGNWVYNPEPSHSSVSENTHIISSKKLSQFTDFPMPDHYPEYPSHELVLAYFDSYANHFGILPYIRFNTKVSRIKEAGDGKWVVYPESSDPELFDFLLVCNGHHSVPSHPDLPGEFDGVYLHSHEFKNNRPFEGKHVLVIGAGNSACDCAVECSRVSSKVSISIRRPHYIVPKFIMGKPTDVFNESAHWLPAPILNPLRKLALKIQIGSYESYGLDEPDFPITYDHPTVNSELLYQLRHGRVERRKGVASISGKTVCFEDGLCEEYDVIIAATGYKIATPFFDKELLDYSEADRIELYLRMFHPELSTLVFIGLVQPQGAIWPLSDLQSKLVSKYIAGSWKLPSNTKELARKEADKIFRSFMKRKRHTIEVDFHQFKALLEKAISQSAVK
jgi:hypothetical protein